MPSPLFKSKIEKRLWGIVLLITTVIYSSIFVGYPVFKFLSGHNLLGLFFGIAMLLCAFVILLHGFIKDATKTNVLLIISMVIIVGLLWLRLELPERTHLIEYTILSIFVHKAFIERYGKNLKAAFFALVVSILIGTTDEVLQLFVPSRFFDYQDIIFNCIVIFCTITFSTLLQALMIKCNSKN